MAAMTLGSKAIGSTVKLNLGGVAWEFRVSHKGKPSAMYDDSFNDGVWLLLNDCYEKRRWHSSNVNSYDSSEIHQYLNGDFLDLFDLDIREQIKPVKIPYRSGSGERTTPINSGANGLSAKNLPAVRL